MSWSCQLISYSSALQVVLPSTVAPDGPRGHAPLNTIEFVMICC